MNPLFLLVGEWIVVLVAVGLLAWQLHRRWDAGWHLWVWGAVAFVGAQLARSPLLLGISLLQPPPETATPLWEVLNVLILGLSAGLFEETARYVLLRWVARDARRWAEGLMFGAGHGGMEAILIVGLAVLNGVLLLSFGDVLLARAAGTSPEAVTALEEAIAELQRLDWGDVLVTLWERAIAITAHIALTLMVLQAVREGTWRWWAAAVLAHAALNIAVILTFRWAGVLPAEGVGTLFALAGLGFIRYARTLDRPTAPTGPDSPATV